MFKELDSLDYSTLIKVCYGIFAKWNSHSGVAHRLPDDISVILYSFVAKYPSYEYKELLVQYIEERTSNEVSSDMKNSGKTFLEQLLK